jgi:hypothetical protein
MMNLPTHGTLGRAPDGEKRSALTRRALGYFVQVVGKLEAPATGSVAWPEDGMLVSLGWPQRWPQSRFSCPRASPATTKPPCWRGLREWARLDSNQGPTDYESAALTN